MIRKNVIRILICLLGLALLCFTILHIKILMFSDITVQPISLEDNPDFKAPTIVHRPPVYLVSYAAGGEIWFKNQHALAESALNKGIDFILNYRASHLDNAFLEKNKHILKHPFGAGYWVWKPYVILKTMQQAPENSIIIYADSGCLFKKSWKPYLLEKALQHDIIFCNNFFEPSNPYLERVAKRYSLIKTGCDTLACRKSPSILATFIVFRNTPTARTFVQKWLDYCQDETLVMNEPNPGPEHPGFWNHHHDQALLNILFHKMPQGTIMLDWEKDFKFIALRCRKPGQEFESLIMHSQKDYRDILTNVFNSRLIIIMRKYFLEKYFTNHFAAKLSRKP